MLQLLWAQSKPCLVGNVGGSTQAGHSGPGSLVGLYGNIIMLQVKL